MKLRIILGGAFGLVVLILLAVMYLPHFPRTGDVILSEGLLLQSMKGFGYEKVGKFNPSWPATVTEVTKSADGIDFQVRGQAPNSYRSEAYKGFDFVAIKFTAQRPPNEEFGFVFRTTNRRP